MLSLKSIKFIFLLNSIIYIFLNPVYSGEIYKWTDADGNVHFGDNPENNPAAIYTVPKNNTSNISTTNEQRAENRKKLLDSFAAEHREQKEQREKQLKNSKVKKYNCQVSTDKLQRYKYASALYVRNDVGEKVYLDKKQRKEETKLLEQQVKKWCK